MAGDLSQLVAALGSDQESVRQAAAEQLLRMGPDAAPAAAALVEAADSDEETRNLATAALEDLGPPPTSALASLVAVLQRSSLDAPYWAATLLGRLQADAASATPSLLAAAEQHGQAAVRQRSVWALGEIGPPAGAALPALERLSADADPRLASLARDAMVKIRR